MNDSASARASGQTKERLFVTAAFATMLGNNIQLIAASLLIYGSAGTALSVGWVYMLVAVPQVLFSVLFGRLADRYDRRRLCLAADVGSALVAGALPVWLALGGARTPAAYTVSVVLSVLAAMFLPASSALMKERVRPERLGAFNSAYEVAYQGGALLSGVVGGFAVQFFGVEPLFAFNAVTFLVSAGCIWALGPRLRPVAGRAAPDTDRSGPSTAGAATAGSGPIVRLSILYAVGSVLIVVSNTLLLVAVLDRFRQGAGLLGIVDALAGVGMVLAAAAYGRIKDRVDYRYLILAGYLGCAVALVLQPLSLWTLLPAILVGGVAFGLGRLTTRTELMRAVEEDRAGRVFGVANGVGLSASVVATVVVATVADGMGVVAAFVTLALLAAVPTVVILGSLLWRDAAPAASLPVGSPAPEGNR